MQTLMINPNELKQYKRNAKKHTQTQIDNVASSIKEFGFAQPVVVDKNNYIIIGHCRTLAAKQLGLTEIPIVKLEDLTEEQANKLRIVDNKLNESEWDFELLAEDIQGINFDNFSFDWSIEFDDKVEGQALPAPQPKSNLPKQIQDDSDYFGDERERTYNSMNLRDFDLYRASEFYQFPTLKKCNHIPNSLIGFNYAKSSTDFESGIHFFIDDYQFERIWNDPKTNIERLKNFDCVLTPDFSLYLDMPMAMKIWNVYRSRLIGQLCQDAGLKVIPTLTWAEPETFSFCFDSIEQGGTVAVSTVGVMDDEYAFNIFKQGMACAVEKIKPSAIICYGSKIDFDFIDTSNIEIKYIQYRKWN